MENRVSLLQGVEARWHLGEKAHGLVLLAALIVLALSAPVEETERNPGPVPYRKMR